MMEIHCTGGEEMILSSVEKKKMKEAIDELQESIMREAKGRNVEINRDSLPEVEEIEEKFDIEARKPRFSFNWQRSRKGWDISKKFVSKEELAKRKREFADYLDKSE
jgi:hypothetical protein